MTRFDHCRRAASVLLVALCLLAIPAVANARFTASKASSLSVGTDRMEAPSAITGSYTCKRSGHDESISVTVNTFTDNGPSGSTYGFGLALGSSIKDTAYSTTKRQTLTGSRPDDGASTTWTLGIQAFLGNWYGAIATKAIVCPPNATKSGSF